MNESTCDTVGHKFVARTKRTYELPRDARGSTINDTDAIGAVFLLGSVALIPAIALPAFYMNFTPLAPIAVYPVVTVLYSAICTLVYLSRIQTRHLYDICTRCGKTHHAK